MYAYTHIDMYIYYMYFFAPYGIQTSTIFSHLKMYFGDYFISVPKWFYTFNGVIRGVYHILLN